VKAPPSPGGGAGEAKCGLGRLPGTLSHAASNRLQSLGRAEDENSGTVKRIAAQQRPPNGRSPLPKTINAEVLTELINSRMVGNLEGIPLRLTIMGQATVSSRAKSSDASARVE